MEPRPQGSELAPELKGQNPLLEESPLPPSTLQEATPEFSPQVYPDLLPERITGKVETPQQLRQAESSELPNQTNALQDSTLSSKVPEMPKVEGLKGNAKQIDEAVAQRPPKEVKKAQSDLKNEYKNALSNESQLAEKPLRDGLEELGFEIKTNKKGDKYAHLGNVKISLKEHFQFI